jgi:flagellar protein FliO/FliZ
MKQTLSTTTPGSTLGAPIRRAAFGALTRVATFGAQARSFAFAAASLATTTIVAAQETTRPFAAPNTVSSPSPSGIASLGQVTLALGFVLAVIFVAAWLLRRMRGFGKTGTGALEIVADLALGQKERAVLVRVGSQQVLIGVAPGRVTTLHVLEEPVVLEPQGGTPVDSESGTAERPNFKSLLMKSLGK